MSDPLYENIGKPITKVIEECAELSEQCSKLIHIICKIERFGLNSFHPNTPDTTNKEQFKIIVKNLKYEISDLLKAIDKLQIEEK